MKQLNEKYKYLEKLLKTYIKFFKHYNKVKLSYTDKEFTVLYYDRKSPVSYEFKSEEIPVDNIDRYILSIRNKISREFNKRKENKYLTV
jgi:hypothetical protein